MRLALAGGEAWFDTLVHLGVPNILFSYYYFRSKLYGGKDSSSGLQLLRKMRAAKKKGYFFILDSGAFTYQQKLALPGARLPSPHPYFAEYKDFLIEYADVFDIVLELDVDGYVNDPKTGKLLDTEQTNEWINELLDVPHLAVKVMPVFHAHRGQMWLDDWLADPRSPYIALSSMMAAGVGPSQVAIAKSHRWGKFVHGLAQTKIKTDLKWTAWDSVDSSTWLRADQFGGTMIWRNNKLIVLDHKHKADRAKFKDWFESWGLDFDKVMRDDLETMRYATIITWREMALYFGRRGKPPYLYDAMVNRGKRPTVHPYIARKEREEA